MKIVGNYFDNKVVLIKNNKFSDSRGYFFESFRLKNFKNTKFVQDNFSFSKHKYTIRGLHYQEKPYSQIKLIHVLKGEISDVVVNINPKNKYFGKYKEFKLSSKNFNMLLIDKDFAHGFCTLEKETLVHYKVSKYYNKNSEKTIKWNDPYLNINWSSYKKKFTISKKDKNGSMFKDIIL